MNNPQPSEDFYHDGNWYMVGAMKHGDVFHIETPGYFHSPLEAVLAVFDIAASRFEAVVDPLQADVVVSPIHGVGDTHYRIIPEK